MKKILSILLVVLIAASTMQLSIFASKEQYIPSYDAAKGQALLNNLGIETLYNDYSQTASRGEMLSLIMQLMNIKSFNVATSPFIDISASEPLASYAQAAINLGIISPGESFMPSKNILMAEACKMGVVALGYANEAILIGGYPVGYLVYAKKLGLLDSMAQPDSETLSVGDMYVFLKNMSEVDIRIQSSYGDESIYTVTPGVNIITYYHDLYEISGVIEANAYTSLYDPDIKSEKNRITISSIQYRYNGDLMLGENIKAYVKDTGITDTIVYAYSYDSEIVCVKGQDISEINANKITITNNEKETIIKTDPYPAIIYNGQASGKIARLNYDHLKNSQITFISNDGDKVFDVISIWQSDPFMIKGTNVSLDKIYDDNSSKTITLDDKKEYLIYVNGVESDLSQIKENMVADVYTSENGSLITIKTSSNVINGKITGYATNEKSLYIDDIKYEYSEYFEKYFKNNAVVGKEIVAFLNSSGLIVGAQPHLATSLKYGYFLKKGETQEINPKVLLKIFTADGKYEIFTLADKVMVDSISNVKAEDVTKDYLTQDQLIRYSLNSDKEINKIDTQYSYSNRIKGEAATCGFLEDNASDNDNLIRYKFLPDNSASKTVHYKYNAMHPYFSLSATSIIFVVDKSPNIPDEKRCLIKNRGNYVNDQKISSDSIAAYNVSNNGNAEIMIEYSQAKPSLDDIDTDNTKLGVVQSFNRALSPDGDLSIKLVMYTTGGNVITAYLKDETLIDNMYASDTNKTNGELPIGPGDLIRCAINTSNEIIAIARDYDHSMKPTSTVYTGTNQKRVDYLGYMYAYNNEDNVIFLSGTTTRNNVATADKIAIYTWDTACIFDSETGIVYPAYTSDIVSYIDDPDNCDYVYLYTNWAQTKLAIVYR